MTTQTHRAPRFELELLLDLPAARSGPITYNEADIATDNGHRATGGLVALRAYWLASYSGADEEVSTIFGDLLSDLMHTADALGLDFEALAGAAHQTYQVELRGEI